MRVLLPTTEQTVFINESRQGLGSRMAEAGTLDGPMEVIDGPCAADKNRFSNGELATVRHNLGMQAGVEELPEVERDARLTGVKPRTRGGTTGLLHQPGGVAVYGEAASKLTDARVRLAAEVMDESDAAIAGPWVTVKWGGARTVADSGVRQLLRPTDVELEAGIVPAPAFVKSGINGDTEVTIHAIHTLLAEQPEVRTRFTLDGLRTVITHPNPHVGLILRGHCPRPDGPLDEVLAEEITTAREKVDSEFGKGKVPIYVDTSHDHAKWEGGGEEGQLRVAASLARLMDQGIIIDGVMMETYILPGNQPDTGTIPGLSQVDKCVRQERAIAAIQALNDARARQQLSVASRA